MCEKEQSRGRLSHPKIETGAQGRSREGTMKKSLLHVTAVMLCLVITSTLFASEAEVFKLEALASFYAEDFHGRPTASGELFDMNALTAAHKTLPFGTKLEITNLENGKQVVVRVNDRGPFVPNREIDLSRGAAEKLDMITAGVARVSIRKVSGPEGTEGTVLVKKAGPASIVTTTNSESGSKTTTPGVTTWRIQLASFSHKANATRLALALQEQGFSPAFEKAGSMIRVVLPGIPNIDLPAVRDRLDSTGYQAYLVRRESR